MEKTTSMVDDFSRKVAELADMAEEMAAAQVTAEEEDVFELLMAAGLVMGPCDTDMGRLCVAALSVACCLQGGMYEVFCELPECVDELRKALDKCYPTDEDE